MSPGKVLDTVEDLRTLLRAVKTVAVVGLSDNPGRESHKIAAYLQGQGFRIVGINPAHASVLGEPCYPSLSELPPDTLQELDLVLVFRKPDAVPSLIEEASRLGLRRVWLQLGVSSPDALEAASAAGIELVAEKCIRVVHSVVKEG
jgi:predicted CoA-binding protein